MRSRGFAVVMGLACGALVVLCAALLLRALKLRERRRALPRALELYGQGELEQALAPLQVAMAAAPDRMDLVHFAATVCLKLKRHDEARAHCLRLRDAASGPERANAELRLALVALEGGKGSDGLAAAIGHLEAACAGLAEAGEQGRLADVLLVLSDAYRRQGDGANAGACLGRLAALPARALRDAAERAATLRQAAAKVSQGGAANLAAAWALLKGRDEPAFAAARAPIALALGLHAGAPALPEEVRRVCLDAQAQAAEAAQKTHGLRLRLSAAAGWSILGDEGAAVKAAREARDLAPKDPTALRVLAGACLAAAAKSGMPKALREEGLAAWRDFLAEAKVPPQEQRQVCLALASRAWNEGRRDEARQLLSAFGITDGVAVERMALAAAVERVDPAAAVKHLRRLEELEGPSPKLAELLKPFTAPPEVLGLRVNALHRYDPRPILIVQFAARAIGSSLQLENVAARLDGVPIQPILTRGELFYRPEKALATGEHKLDVALADSQGLKAERTLAFTIEDDAEPPAILGISPEPDGKTADQSAVVSFRCADPSGIAPGSLNVAFSSEGEGGKRREAVIVSQGVYQVDIKGTHVKIPKGTRVEFGIVAFQPAQGLPAGTCRVKVTVDDVRGNRCSKEWAFQCAP